MTSSFTSADLTTQQDSLGTGGAAHGQLIEGQAFTASLDDTGTGSLGESHGGNGHLGDIQETDIVSDGGNNDGSLAFSSLAQVLGNGGNGDGGTVSVTHVQTLQDGGVEGRTGTAAQERVELDQELVIRVGSLDFTTSILLDVVTLDINTLKRDKNERLVNVLSMD